MSDKMIVITEYTEEATLTYDELCELCGVPQEVIVEIIEYDIVQPEPMGEALRFQAEQLNRLKTAIRLHRQLEINLQGVALALELMDEIEQLRARAAMLERHVLK